MHLAWDLVLRHVVAIKTLRPEFVSTEMFRQEAAIMIDFHHEAIVRAHHFEPRPEEDGPYLVMEYVPWKTAEQWVADVGELLLPAAAVLEVGRQVCEALQYAHERSVLHLDIKPANIFVDSAAERAKLSDFGIARLGSGGRRTALQQKPLGTPAYMAPEQMQVGAKLSPATDLYQLAVTLWDLLVGKPYEPSGAIPPVDSSRAHILELLQPALSNIPSQRPSDAQSFRNLLAFAASNA